MLRDGGIARPTLIFSAITLSAGVIVTFLPLALPADARQLAPVALLVQSIATPTARWAAGRLGDRRGSHRQLVPGVLATALGTAALAWLDSPYAVLVGAGLFGLGFGITQNVTLALMFERVEQVHFGRVSALWNLAYDAGMGIGAMGIGLLIGVTGYAVGFAVAAAVVFTALWPALRDHG
jgi:MFS family permease